MIEIVRGYALMLIGGYCYLTRSGLRRDAALLGAALFAFGAYNTFHFMHINVTAIVAHLPFMAWAVEVALRSRDRRRVAIAVCSLAALNASQLMFGHPQFAWLNLLALGALTLYRMMRGVGRTRWPWLLAALAIGFAMAGVQLVPQIESLRDSFRRDPGDDFLGRLVFKPYASVLLLSPYLFPFGSPRTGELVRHDLYLGAVVPVLCVWIVIRWRALGPWRNPVVGAAAVGLFGVVMAMGPRAELFDVYTVLPLVRLFRAPERHLVLLSISAAIIAAIAFTDLVRLCERSGCLSAQTLVWLGLPIAGSLAIGVAAHSGAFVHKGGVVDSSLTGIVLGIVLFAIAALLVAVAARGHRFAIPALLVFAVFDVGAYGLQQIRRAPRLPIEAYAAKQVPPAIGDEWRVAYVSQAATLKGLRLVSGYAAMEPDRVLPMFQLRFPPPARSLHSPDRASLRVAGVAWAGGLVIDAPLPRARLVSAAVPETQVLVQLGQVDVEQVAIVRGEVDLESGSPGEVVRRVEQAGHLVFEVHAPGRQLLVIAEAFHRGWVARIDGEQAEIVRAYGDFMGVVVDVESAEVRLDFEPESLRQGLRVTTAGLLAFVALAALSFRYGVRPAPLAATGRIST